MVFVLRNVVQGEILILGPNRTYSLGRSRRNSIHLLDVTVNNSHATLEIGDGHADIQDNSTDFGTWVNKQRINAPFRLRNGDVIVFGKKDCKYVFLEPKYKALIDHSVLEPSKRILAQALKELNVSLDENYSINSSHFITETVSLKTLKEKTILYYLIDRKTVITPKYFIDILTNINEAPLIPNIYRYMPEIDNYLKSRGIVDINPRKNRRHIFELVVFILFDKQCDDDLCGLILKCGGEAMVCNQKKNFYNDLLGSMNRYKYVAVNHDKNNKKSPLMYSFLRTMKQKKKKVVEINADDVYVSVLKGELVGVNETPLQDSPKEPRPGTSKPAVNCSEGESSGAESEQVDIVCKVIKDKESNGKKDTASPNTFSRTAAEYKQHKTLREVVLQNNERSPTLNRWVTRKKKKAEKLNHISFENGVTSSSTFNGMEECNKDEQVNKEEDEDRLLRELEEIFGTSEDENKKMDVCTSPITKRQRKRSKNVGVQDTMQKVDTDSVEPNLGRPNSKINGKKRSVVINPYALKQSPKVVKEERNDGVPVEKWLKKYKKVDIIPVV